MKTLRVLVVGLAGGLVGQLLNLPAGPLLGSLTAVALVNILTDGRLKIHPGFRTPSRVLIGASIGSLATPALLHTLGASIGWALAMSVGILLLCIVLGLLFSWATGVDRRTAMLASCPGGVAEMAALADESNADVELVIGFHVVRKIAVLVGAVVWLAIL